MCKPQKLINFLKKLYHSFIELTSDRYVYHPEAVIIACYYNPYKSPYRKAAFDVFYDSIKHLEHRIVELVIGDAEPELNINKHKHITQHHTDTLLWHKETILNNIISTLPDKYKYVFWLDADVLFEYKYWLVDSVYELSNGANIIQPFKNCVHLEKDEFTPRKLPTELYLAPKPNKKDKSVWNSFAYNQTIRGDKCSDHDYNTHGHVGFAWGIKRSILDEVKLFDHALIGGADHIMAHCAEGEFDHPCLTKVYDEKTLAEIKEWGEKFYALVDNKFSYSLGTLSHIWHGDLVKRDYYNRIKTFEVHNKEITQRDSMGYYVANPAQMKVMVDYYKSREVIPTETYNMLNITNPLNMILLHSVLDSTSDSEERSIEELNKVVSANNVNDIVVVDHVSLITHTADVDTTKTTVALHNDNYVDVPQDYQNYS